MDARAAPAGRRAAAAAATVALVLWLGALLALGQWARSHDYFQPDEAIALAVTDRVLQEGTLDTNWARTAVEPTFRYDQYNFSAYYLAAAGWQRLAGAPDAPEQGDRLAPLRVFSGWLHALAVVLAGWLGLRWGGWPAAVFGALLGAASPNLLQDALYARPESFVTALTLVLLLLATAAPRLPQALAAGLVAGLLVATKVSFVPLAPLALAALLLPADGARRGRRTIVFLLALPAGFALGAPYAVLHPVEYLHGVHALFAQYGGGHLPHGLPWAGTGARLAYGLDYLRHAVGVPLLLLAPAGLLVLLHRDRRREALLAAGLLVLLLYFLQTRAFFERNFSHVLPVLFVLAGVAAGALATRLTRGSAARASLLAAIAAVSLLAPVALSRALLREALPDTQAAHRRALEDALGAAGHAVVGLEMLPALRRAGLCGPLVARQVDYGHPDLHGPNRNLVDAHGLRPWHHLPGPFSGQPTSTLHTYHGSDLRYHAVREAWPDGCALGVVALPVAPRALDVPEPRLEGAARRDGQYLALAPADWTVPLYGTHAGDDAHRGAIGLATIRACRDFVLPVASGPTRAPTRLQLARLAPEAATLFDGPLPPLPEPWAGLQVRHRSEACAEYAVSFEDRGAEWGAWVGLGHPVHAVHLTPPPLPVPP